MMTRLGFFYDRNFKMQMDLEYDLTKYCPYWLQKVKPDYDLGCEGHSGPNFAFLKYYTPGLHLTLLWYDIRSYIF